VEHTSIYKRYLRDSAVSYLNHITELARKSEKHPFLAGHMSALAVQFVFEARARVMEMGADPPIAIIPVDIPPLIIDSINDLDQSICELLTEEEIPVQHRIKYACIWLRSDALPFLLALSNAATAAIAELEKFDVN